MSARRRHSIFINQYTGEILGTRNREQSFARFVHLLHTRFLAGEIGEHLAGGFTVVMLFLAASGIVLWWPRKIVWPKAGVSWKRTNFDLHNTLGFYSSIIMFVIALAGVLIAFEAVLDPLVLRLNAAPEADVSKLQSMPEPGARRIPPEDAVAVADRYSARRLRQQHQRAGGAESDLSRPVEISGGPHAGRAQPRVRRPIQRHRRSASSRRAQRSSDDEW